MHRKHITIPLFLLVMQPGACSQHFLDIQVVDENGGFLSYDYHDAHKIHLDIQNTRHTEHNTFKTRSKRHTSSEFEKNHIKNISFTESYLRSLYQHKYKKSEKSENNQHSSSSKNRQKRSSSNNSQFQNFTSSFNFNSSSEKSSKISSENSRFLLLH